MHDRGFIKWQPFNSVTSPKVIFEDLKNNEKILKPTLFPEEIERISNEICEAYYEKSIIEITIYECNKLKTYKTSINKINTAKNIITLGNKKNVHFKQIVKIKM